MHKGDSMLQPDTNWTSAACTLDHDGCVVCADAGIPLQVIAICGEDAECEDAAGNQTVIAIELVADVRVGDILLTHGGVAIGRGAGSSLAPRREDGVDEIRK